MDGADFWMTYDAFKFILNQIGIVRITESSLTFLPSDHGHSSWTQ